MIAALYCRVSSDSQREKQTIETQKRILADYAERQGWKILDWYVDDGINNLAVVRTVSESDNLTKQIVNSSRRAKPLTTVKLLIQMQLSMKLSKKEGSIAGEALSDCELSPLDETALARQFKSSALRRLETTQLRPTMTGPTKTEERRGMKSHGKVQGPHRRGREFPERSESCSRRELCRV